MTQSSVNPFVVSYSWGSRGILPESEDEKRHHHCQVFPALNTKLHVLVRASEFNKMLKISLVDGI